MSEFRSYEEFFPYYVGEHSRAATRWIHFAGTHLGLATAATAVLTRRPALLAGAPVVAYGMAWFSHFAVEGNRPATFGHPLWSLRGDWQMIATMWRGRDAELGRIAGEVRRRVGTASPAVELPGLVEGAPTAVPAAREG